MIEGVIVTLLRQIVDKRGKIMHMLRCDDEHFKSFGEVYFSCIKPGVIKGWNIHKKMTLNYAVPHGNIRLVLYDNRVRSSTMGNIQEIFMGTNNYCLVTVPPMIWNSFKGIGTETAIVTNCATLPHDPEEIHHKDPTDPSIPYNWNIHR